MRLNENSSFLRYEMGGDHSLFGCFYFLYTPIFLFCIPLFGAIFFVEFFHFLLPVFTIDNDLKTTVFAVLFFIILYLAIAIPLMEIRSWKYKRYEVEFDFNKKQMTLTTSKYKDIYALNSVTAVEHEVRKCQHVRTAVAQCLLPPYYDIIAKTLALFSSSESRSYEEVYKQDFQILEGMQSYAYSVSLKGLVSENGKESLQVAYGTPFYSNEIPDEGHEASFANHIAKGLGVPLEIKPICMNRCYGFTWLISSILTSKVVMMLINLLHYLFVVLIVLAIARKAIFGF